MIDQYSHIRPGDRAPRAAYATVSVARCGARFMSHHCDRFRGHPGQHISGVDEVTAVWIGRPGFVVRGLTRDSDQDAHVEYRSLLPAINHDEPDEPDEPDEAGATLSREHVRHAIARRVEIGIYARETANALLRELGLDEVEEPYKIVTVEVKVKTTDTLPVAYVRDAIDGGGLPLGMEVLSFEVTGTEEVR